MSTDYAGGGGMIKIYVINLPRCRERREHILAECARFGLEPEIFPGVDVMALNETELRRLVFEPDRNPLTPPEVACVLSHLGIYRDMVEKNIPHAMILEDDSVFRTDPRPLLAGLECLRADAPEVYLLTHRSNQYISGEQRSIGAVRFYRGWNGVGANGYVITKSAAANILQFQTPIKCVCDWWKFFQLHRLITFYVSESEIIGLHPELGDVSNSLLEESRLACPPDKRNRYYRHLRKETPFRFKAGHILRKFRSWRGIRA